MICTGALLDAHLFAQVYLIMTGGQSSLFEETQASEAAAKQEKTTAINNAVLVPRNLVVISATSDELAAHEAKLEKMKEKSQCVWLD